MLCSKFSLASKTAKCVKSSCIHQAEPTYFIWLIKDTEGTLILRLGSELKVFYILRDDLPVCDQVALGGDKETELTSPGRSWNNSLLPSFMAAA